MTERLLQYLWQFQYFNKQGLVLDNGETLQIIYPGHFNTNQGPDFLEARIKIEATTWVGHIELHIKTSDWLRHDHQNDHNYDNVVLHVVWEDDCQEKVNDIPVLSLQPLVPIMLLQQYSAWMQNPSFIACGSQAQQVSPIVWMAWKERMLAERLERRSNIVFACLQQNNYHWEETFWWLLARNFGITVNTEPFEAIARSLPVTLLAKHKNQLQQLEALLLGQAGLLQDNASANYAKLLQQEYCHLKNKYKLHAVPQPVHFLRMRPGNFPSIRLAQLAMLIYRASHLFAHIKDTINIEDIKKLLSVTASDFWNTHYSFLQPSRYMPKTLGSQMVQNIIINSIVPVLFAYGQMHGEEQYKNKALHWLNSLSAEKNAITGGFAQLGIANTCAYDSQGLIELKANYCDRKRCLDCAIGNALLKGFAARRAANPL